MEDKILKQIEEKIKSPLTNYINDKHTQEECIGFIAGFSEGFKTCNNIKESVDEKLVCDIQKYLKDDVDLGFLKKKDVERINYYLDTFFKSKSATKNTVSNEVEWISVKDRLPEKEGHYLGYTRDKYFRQAKFQGGVFHSDDYDGQITHYQKLPNPPKEK